MTKIIHGGQIIDATGAEPYLGSIVIEDHKIGDILTGKEAEVAVSQAHDEVIDASGQWLIPGLINMHEHLMLREVAGFPWDAIRSDVAELSAVAVKNAIVGLARGWTTVRDMASNHNIAVNIRDLIHRGQLIGPRVIAVGAPISVTGGHGWPIAHEADGPDAIRAAVREQFKLGADHVKLMASNDPVTMPGPEQTRDEMTFAEIAAAYDEAHRWGRLAGCHVMGTRAIHNVLEAGADIIDHAIYMTPELAKRAVQQETAVCLTLSGYCTQTFNPKFRRGEAWSKAHEVLVAPHKEAAVAAVEAGCLLVTGTDTTGDYAEEVELLREAGLSSMESILACTANGAKALRLENEIGRLRAGLQADIVILNGNPLDDPYALREVNTVFRSGVQYDPKQLMASIPSELHQTVER